MHAWMCKCMYDYLYVYMCVCVCVCVYLNMWVSMCTFVYALDSIRWTYVHDIEREREAKGGRYTRTPRYKRVMFYSAAVCQLNVTAALELWTFRWNKVCAIGNRKKSFLSIHFFSSFCKSKTRLVATKGWYFLSELFVGSTPLRMIIRWL